MNEFTKKPEIIFIVYDEVIKSPYPFILNLIKKELRPYYEDYLDLSILDKMDSDNIMRFCIQRHEKNIFRMLAKKEFDYDEALKDIVNKFDDLYINCDLLSIGKSIEFIKYQKFTEKIYIYTPEYDKRIHFDIQSTFQDMNKINYVTGPFYDVISSLDGVTSYILNDILDLSTLLALDKTKYTNILVANYGYNYSLTDDNKLVLRMNPEPLMDKYIFKFGLFLPNSLTENHFSDLFKDI